MVDFVNQTFELSDMDDKCWDRVISMMHLWVFTMIKKEAFSLEGYSSK